MPHVLIPDSVNQKAIDIVKNADGLTVSAPGKLSQDELVAQVGDAHALIIRSGVKITPEVFAAAPNLKIVARAGVGVDNVDLDAATEHGVMVVNTPAGNTISTAEHTFGLMLALARFIPQGHATMSAGRWDRKLFEGVELRGKILGLVGFGRIGQAMAVRAKAFEMTVLAYDPFLSNEVFNDMGVTRVDLDTLYAQSDFISLHAPLLKETTGMIDAAAFAKMKKGIRLINAARGGLIVDADLAEAIKSGKVAGAALDVFEPEPPAADNPLLNLEGVIHTPHLAASTSDAQITVAIEAAQLVVAALVEGKYENVVNRAVLETIG